MNHYVAEKLSSKVGFVSMKNESFYPNKSLPRRKLFHNYGLFTGRECNVFDMRLLQIPKVTHVSVSAKLLVAKLSWGQLLIFEPKDAKYRAMEFSF